MSTTDRKNSLKMLLQNLCGIYNSLQVGVERIDISVQVEVELERVREMIRELEDENGERATRKKER